MNQQPTFTIIESIFDKSKEYVDNRIEYFKIKMVDKTASIASSVVAGAALFIFLFLFFILFNIGLSLLIGDLVGRSWAGFLILAVVYAIAGLVIFKGREKWVKAPIINKMIKKFL
ncbi:MAG: hypothetical protein JWQ96_845 [Segetibacter sp.]|nr:hypothetical protein [Segetibacter sp.]